MIRYFWDLWFSQFAERWVNLLLKWHKYKFKFNSTVLLYTVINAEWTQGSKPVSFGQCYWRFPILLGAFLMDGCLVIYRYYFLVQMKNQRKGIHLICFCFSFLFSFLMFLFILHINHSSTTPIILLPPTYSPIPHPLLWEGKASYGIAS